MDKSKKRFTIVLLSTMLVLLLIGCVAKAPNVKSGKDLKDKKVLAGRFIFFKDFDDPTPLDYKDDYHYFRIFFNKNGETEEKQFQLDKEGYVYTAVDEGQYNIGHISVQSVGPHDFLLNPFPTIYVSKDDSVVNFGTIKVTFHQSAGSKVADFFVVGFGRAHLRVDNIPDYDNTRPEITSRVGDFAGPIRDVRVQYLRRSF